MVALPHFRHPRARNSLPAFVKSRAQMRAAQCLHQAPVARHWPIQFGTASAFLLVSSMRFEIQVASSAQAIALDIDEVKGL